MGPNNPYRRSCDDSNNDYELATGEGKSGGNAGSGKSRAFKKQQSIDDELTDISNGD